MTVSPVTADFLHNPISAERKGTGQSQVQKSHYACLIEPGADCNTGFFFWIEIFRIVHDRKYTGEEV